MKRNITSWQQFSRNVRSKGCHLLKELNQFDQPILVSGCQRSGGTMLAGIISSSEGVENFAWSHDDELDAALILSGYNSINNQARYCFQTTYLNECVNEYRNLDNYKLIWLLRNPYSVVYSLLHNWKRFALNELFLGCGYKRLPEGRAVRLRKYGMYSISRLERAIYSYNAKISQIEMISTLLSEDRLRVIDYDDLVINKEERLPMLYEFIQLPYKQEYANAIRASSLDKREKLSIQERSLIDRQCKPVYESLRHKYINDL